MRRFLENWGLTIAAVCIGLLLLCLAGGVVGCSFFEGARDAALEEVSGTPSPGRPSDTSGTGMLLYTIGGVIAGALGKHFIGKRKA